LLKKFAASGTTHAVHLKGMEPVIVVGATKISLGFYA